MPSTSNPTCELEDDGKNRYLAELHIPRDSSLVHKDPLTVFADKYSGFEVIELVRYSHVFYPGRDQVFVAPNDLLLVKASANDIVEILRDGLANLPLSEKGFTFSKSGDQLMLVELIIPPQSNLLRQKLRDTELFRDPNLHLIAIKRNNLRYTEQALKDITLRIGISFYCGAQR